MDITFRTKKLQKTCNKIKVAIQTYGSNGARKLQQRLMELYSANTLKDISHLPPARCHELSGNRKGQFSVDLQHPFRLLFVPANESTPLKDDGSIDKVKVTEIIIVEIVDTH